MEFNDENNRYYMHYNMIYTFNKHIECICSSYIVDMQTTTMNFLLL